MGLSLLNKDAEIDVLVRLRQIHLQSRTALREQARQLMFRGVEGTSSLTRQLGGTGMIGLEDSPLPSTNLL
eukprot:5794176-Amphidinium_carterae.2